MLLLHGSGKTAVLVERIIQKILKDEVDIDKLLVVTFTNAAASEMRERVLNAIYKRLEDDPDNIHLLRQITLLNKASICTIDSFCLEIVRDNFYELQNVSPNFRIADTTEIDLLKQEVLEDLFEQKYENEDEDFVNLITTYTSYKDDTPLKDLVLKIFNYIQSNPFPNKWLKEKVELFNLKDKLDDNFSDTVWGKELVVELREEILDDITYIKNLIKLIEHNPEFEKHCICLYSDIDKLENLERGLSDWDKAYSANQDLKFDTWPRASVTDIDLKDKVKDERNAVKKHLQTELDKILIFNSRQANEDMYDMYPTLVNLENLVFDFEKEFSKRKRDKNIVDFNDIEHFALEILLKEENGELKPTNVANKYKEKFIEIAIDEYQDSNLVQESILNAISRGNNIFMVGDVKQSIYRFRQARPDLFLDKYLRYRNKNEDGKEEGLKIQLFKNFRSRKNVLDFTNLVFQDIMSIDLGDIDYDEQEYLNLGASYLDIEQNLNTEIDVINLLNQEEENNNFEEDSDESEVKEKEERVEDIELEARFVANRIKQLIDEKYQVFDKKIDGYRDITYKDIVVLLRATSTSAPIFEQEILNLEMPVFSDSSQEYLDSIEIQTIMSLLKIIDNPIQDIPLVTVLRSHIGKFTDDDLVKIRLSDSYDNFYTCLQKALIDAEGDLKNKTTNFLNMLDTFREEQEYLALDELIWKIYMDTGFYNYVGLMTNGELRQANLKMLFQKAKQFETANFKGLYNFIKFIEKLSLSSGDLGSAKLIGENDNVIRIMSIHKSKGLEFPVVFLANTGKQFNLMDLNQNILLHQELGLGVKYIDYDKQVQYNTLSRVALRNKVFVETLSEEMRILYVALTRAREKLIITGLSKDYEKEILNIKKQIECYEKVNNKANYILVKKYKKYLDWILLVYFYEKENIKDVDFNVYNKNDLLSKLTKIDKVEVDVKKILESNVEINKEQIAAIDEVLNYKYENQLATLIPTKTSVTSLKELSLINKESENIDNHNQIEFEKPKFIVGEKKEKITASKKGTLVHLCLQKLNPKLDYDYDKIKELVDSLVIKDIITREEADCININKIYNFTKSNIWKELQEAKEIYQEKPFYINIPAKEIYKEDIQEDILVQGIIDLYYINKNNEIILVDYKTDFVNRGEEDTLVKKYKNQLELYEKALEQGLNRKVDKKYIYSVYLDKEIGL